VISENGGGAMVALCACFARRVKFIYEKQKRANGVSTVHGVDFEIL